MVGLRRRTVAIGVSAAVLAGVVAYGAVGFVGMQIASAEPGGCPASHAAFTPASFKTDATAAVSGEFDASSLDPTPYLMPDYQDVSFPARSEPGVTIRAWWVPPADANAPAIVVVHGEGSCRRDPAILVPAGMLHRDGFGVLLIDMRNNGDSTRVDGRYGFGSVEYRDVEGAWDWLVARGVPPPKIGLFGHSGGAPAVTVAMGEDTRIAAGWEESGPADIWTVASAEAHRNGLPEIGIPAAVFWFMVLGDDVINRSPLAEAAKFGMRPFQVVHGTADGRIEYRNAELLEGAVERGNPANRMWTIEGGHHVEGPFLMPAEYERRLGAFFNAALGG